MGGGAGGGSYSPVNKYDTFIGFPEIIDRLYCAYLSVYVVVYWGGSFSPKIESANPAQLS